MEHVGGFGEGWFPRLAPLSNWSCKPAPEWLLTPSTRSLWRH